MFIYYGVVLLFMAEFEDLEEYGAYLQANGVKDRRMSYLRRLREAYGKPLLELSAMELNAWIGGLAIAPTTHQLVVSYVRNALKYLNGGDFPAVSKQIARRKGKTQVSRVKSARELLTEEEVEDLIAATPRADLKALIALHEATGTRPAEILTLDREDLQFVSVKGVSVLRVSIRKTKTQSPRTVSTPDKRAIRYLREWLKTGNGTGPLWTFHSPQTYWKKLKNLTKKAGISKNVYPYLFRHMRGTELYDAPPDVRDIQMGWTPGSNMYANYTHLRPDQVEEAIIEREAGPVEKSPKERITQLMKEVLEILRQEEPNLETLSLGLSLTDSDKPLYVAIQRDKNENSGEDSS